MIFKDGIEPMWEDEANARGGKITFRVRKGITNRLWEEIVSITSLTAYTVRWLFLAGTGANR